MCFVVNIIRMDEEHFPWPTWEFKLLKIHANLNKKNLFMIKKLISGISHTPELFDFCKCWKCDDLYYLLIV